MKAINCELDNDGLTIAYIYEFDNHEEAHRAGWHAPRAWEDLCEHCAATCIECGEERWDEDGNIDVRVEVGMKCGVCAYGA